VTSFVGREREIDEVAATLVRARLVTLTGTGGVGKTRLAIQVAEEVAGEYPDGVCFVDLSALGDPTQVPGSVARALGIRERHDRTPEQVVRETLHPLDLLLVLDNCEHLLDACAGLVESLLSGCPKLTVLATSRQPLGILGETTWRVVPLSLPDDAGWEFGKQPPPDAVRLFVERAIAAVHTFRLTAGNAEDTIDVCRRLDGIPLAIELAAARLRALSVAELAQRLEDRLSLLTHGSRTALPRQQTLRATLDWSYELLSEPERILLRRLTVFAGGCTLAAAEGVCAEGAGYRVQGAGYREGAAMSNTLSPVPCTLYPNVVLDLLTALVEKSLVQYEEQAPGTRAVDGGRYQLLETVRQYAHDRLRETGEAPAVRDRHLSFFRRWVEETTPKLRGGEQGVWLDRLERDHANLHAAIDWSLETEEGWKEGLPLAEELFTYWDLRHRFGEAREYPRRFAERSAAWPVDARARALHQAGHVAMRLADRPAALRYFEECRALRRQQGVLQEDPGQLQCLAALALNVGDCARAAALLHESLDIYREFEEAGREFDRHGQAWALDMLGCVACCEEDLQAAHSYYEQGLALFRELDSETGIASTLLGLGRVAMRQGAHSPARARLHESLTLFRDVKVKHSAVEVLNSLAWICWHEGDFAMARAHLLEALVLCRETARAGETGDTLISAGHVVQRQGNPAQAARYFGAADALRAAIGLGIAPVERAEWEESITAARAALGEAAFAAAWAEGERMTLEEAINLALEDLGDAPPA
jgi:predicted ATPase